MDQIGLGAKKVLVWMYLSFRRLVDRFLVRWTMMTRGVNRFTAMQMVAYRGGTSNHLEHNDNPDYWNLLLGVVKEKNFNECNALDFACGKGRNVSNLLTLANWSRVDGVDISPGNIEHCAAVFDSKKSKFWITGGGIWARPRAISTISSSVR